MLCGDVQFYHLEQIKIQGFRENNPTFNRIVLFRLGNPSI
jgi:hypothetical protein